MLSMSSNLISGIPNRAYPFPGTTKNLHMGCLFLCLIYNLHIPKSEVLVLLYVLNIIPLFLSTLNAHLLH